MIVAQLLALAVTAAPVSADRYALIWSDGDRAGLIQEASIKRRGAVVTFKNAFLHRQPTMSPIFNGQYDYNIGIYELDCRSHLERFKWAKWLDANGKLEFEIDHPSIWKPINPNTADVIHLCVAQSVLPDLVSLQEVLGRLRSGHQPTIGTGR